MAPCVADLQLNSTLVIACYHPFMLYLQSYCVCCSLNIKQRKVLVLVVLFYLKQFSESIFYKDIILTLSIPGSILQRWLFIFIEEQKDRMTS